MEKRKLKLWLADHINRGLTDKQILEEGLIPRRTFYRWKARYLDKGLITLLNDKQKGTQPPQVVQEIVKRILDYRDKYLWGPTRIEGHMRVHDKIRISHRQIYKILVAANKNKPLDYERKTWGKKHFERLHSMTLLQADFKLLQEDVWMVTLLDDHSRFVPVSSTLDGFPKAEDAIKALEFACGKHGFPEQVLTDRGVQFFNNRGGLSSFTQFCNSNGIQHIVASPRRPSTIGKLEAFHGCYDAERYALGYSHKKYIRYWNYKRPHSSIGYLYPNEVFVRDRKSAINAG